MLNRIQHMFSTFTNNRFRRPRSPSTVLNPMMMNIEKEASMYIEPNMWKVHIL